MRAVIHCRISTEEKNGGQKLDSQIFSTLDYAGKNDLQVVDQYLENGWSGELTQRPELDRLLGDAAAGKFDAIIDCAPDRLSRNQTHQLFIIGRLEELGIKIHFVSNPGYEDLSQESKIMTKGLYAMVAELERLKIIQRTTRGRISKVSSGNVCTSRPPYGYKYVVGNKEVGTHGKFIFDKSEIETVKLVLSYALEGRSDRWIIRALKEQGVTPRKGAATFAKSSIAKILTTNLSVYTGVWFYNKFEQTIPKSRLRQDTYVRSKKTSRRLRGKDEWIQVNIPELAVITPEQAEVIIQKRKSNRVEKRSTKNNYLLQRMVYHTDCGKPCYSDSFHGVPYYRCSDRKSKYGIGEYCKGESTKAMTLEEEVWNQVMHLMLNPKLIVDSAQEYIDTHKDDGVIRSQDLSEIEQKRSELRKQLSRVEDGYREGLYTITSAKEQKAKIEENQIALDKKEESLKLQYQQSSGVKYESLLDDVEELAKDLVTVIKGLSFEERQQILKWMSIKVEYSNKTYRLEGSLPIYKAKNRSVGYGAFDFDERSPRIR